MSSTAEMFDYLDEKINLAEQQGLVMTAGLIRDIRNAVQRDAERRGKDLAEIVKVEQQRKATVTT